MDTDRAWHADTADEAAKALLSDIPRGLTGQDAKKRLDRYGPNVLANAKQRSVLAIIVYQFRSLIVGLLLSAAGIAFALGDVAEAIAILTVIVINAAIGFATEYKAASALAGLRKQAVSVARVMREGAERQIPEEELVPGDIVLLGAGDRVPGDGRIVEQADLQVDESALTGESLSVAKSVDPVADRNALVGDRFSMAYLGTAVTEGRARFIVTATGTTTEMGKIGALIDAVGDHGTPLEAKLAQLSRSVLLIVVGLCAVIVLVGWLRGVELLYMFEVGISLAIAAVPEGLLAVTTMTLAVGMQRMARMNALVRRLPAVETLALASEVIALRVPISTTSCATTLPASLAA